MRALVRYFTGRRSGQLPPRPPSKSPTLPRTSMGRMRYAAMNGREWWPDYDTTDPKSWK